ncbi:hypothetical protein AVL50_06775 [Flammeovirga sp. SJP92]|nr:hypothetical protein AVL50_06775 [Flammeovirga sp. SJP92]
MLRLKTISTTNTKEYEYLFIDEFNQNKTFLSSNPFLLEVEHDYHENIKYLFKLDKYRFYILATVFLVDVLVSYFFEYTSNLKWYTDFIAITISSLCIYRESIYCKKFYEDYSIKDIKILGVYEKSSEDGVSYKVKYQYEQKEQEIVNEFSTSNKNFREKKYFAQVSNQYPLIHCLSHKDESFFPMKDIKVLIPIVLLVFLSFIKLIFNLLYS